MEIILERTTPSVPPAMAALPADRSQWPEDAGRAFHRLQRELDLWSHDNGWTRSGNSWIAEEAVRRGWVGEDE